MNFHCRLTKSTLGLHIELRIIAKTCINNVHLQKCMVLCHNTIS